MPGWTASVDGDTTPITTVERAFQQISVPAGTHEISYSFIPNHVPLAMVVSLGGFAVFGYGALGTLRAARRRNRPTKDIVLLDEVDEPLNEGVAGATDASTAPTSDPLGELSVAPSEPDGPSEGALA
jgi:hypothetical protein